MRIALLSDIHGNLQALQACLRHAAGRGADRYVFLGDFVGYGGDPRGVVEVIAEYVEKGAIALRGNHDEAIETRDSYFNAAAQAALEYARGHLDAGHRKFLAGLPLEVREGALCFVHASADAPAKWNYIDSPGAAKKCAEAAKTPFTFCGHIHDQMLYFESSAGRMNEFHPLPGTTIPMHGGRRWVILVGSVGQPRDRNPAAAYAMFDATRLQLIYHRVAYDAAAAAQVIRAAGLPESLAHRVETGI